MRVPPALVDMGKIPMEEGWKATFKGNPAPDGARLRKKLLEHPRGHGQGPGRAMGLGLAVSRKRAGFTLPTEVFYSCRSQLGLSSPADGGRVMAPIAAVHSLDP